MNLPARHGSALLSCLPILFLAPGRGALCHDDPGPGFSIEGQGGFFVRGDADQNAAIEITDAVATLGFLFLGAERPFCMDALDANDDGALNVTDPVFTLNFLFLGGAALPAPHPGPEIDPTEDALDCDNGRFAYIRRQIFDRKCSTTSCHSRAAAKGGLVLEGIRAYSDLVGVPSSNETARAAGLRRVKAGDPDQSFLMRKIAGPLGPNDGDPMPEIGRALTAEEIDLIEHWIEDGAVPSSPADIILPFPTRGEQILIPPFPVLSGKEVQRNYFFKLKSDEDIWVNRIQFLYPPGSHHLNLFSGAPSLHPDGFFEDDFKIVPFGTWDLRAASQLERLDWTLPEGVAVRFKARQQLLAQIHFVNIGSQTAPIGGCAAINLHTIEATTPPMTLGSLFLQNKNIVIPPRSTVSFDYGITFGYFGHNVPVKLAALTGHFHWRGKSFEIRLWDGLNKNVDGSPAAGEFDRMGSVRTIFHSDNWDEPDFLLFGEGDAPHVPAGWGVVYRTIFVNDSDLKYCFGPHVETQEHANAFIFFYPGPVDSEFLWFPPECIGQGCTVPCF